MLNLAGYVRGYPLWRTCVLMGFVSEVALQRTGFGRGLEEPGMSVAKVVIEAGRTRYVVVDGHGELVEPIAHYLKYLDLCGMARNTLRTLRRRSPYPGMMYRHLLWLTTYSSTRDWPPSTTPSIPIGAT